MKKITIILALFGAVCLSSCNVKECRCYQFVGDRWTGPNANYTSPENKCAALNNQTTLCNEMDDPILNPDDIAVGKKKK